MIPWKRRIGGEFGIYLKLPAGCYSDDTQLRLATCRSIRWDGFFDVETFSKVELPIWLSYSLGAGRGTKKSAEFLKNSQIRWDSNFYKSDYASYLNGGGNGAAMRIQPHVWCSPKEKDNKDILKDVIRNTIITHGHSRAMVGAAFHALILREALISGKIPDSSAWFSIVDKLKELPDIIHLDKELLFYWLPNWEKEKQQSITRSIFQSVEELREDIVIAEKSLTKAKRYEDAGETYAQLVKQIGCLQRDMVGSAPKTALLASYLSYVYRDRPIEGLIEAVNLFGSDTDTIATMAGAIMGVKTKDDPPEEVADIKYIIEESERLYEISEGQNTRSHLYPDMLYWRPGRTQLDVIGKYNGKWYVQGLGEAEPMEIVAEKGGKYPSIWQWFRLEFGQTVLVKRRPKPKTFTKDCLPVKITTKEIKNKDTIVSDQKYRKDVKEMSKQKELWDKEKLANIHEEPDFTIDIATYNSINSGFKEEVVGQMLMKLAEQKDGIEKSIAFAAIIAKAKQARMKKGGEIENRG
ncbi:hypothetical protein ES703_90585 [subsurface metagenome]